MLNNKKHEAEIRVKVMDELSSQILAALDSITEDPVSDIKISYGLLQTSAAKSSFLDPICNLMFTCISWFLSATVAGFNGNWKKIKVSLESWY